MGLMKKIFGDYSSRELKSIYPIVDKIESMADEYKACLLYTSPSPRDCS